MCPRGCQAAPDAKVHQSLSVIVRTVCTVVGVENPEKPLHRIRFADRYGIFACAADDSDVDRLRNPLRRVSRPGRRGTWRGQVGQQQHTGRGAAADGEVLPPPGGEQPRTDHAGYEQELR